jgi:hypothetical protein
MARDQITLMAGSNGVVIATYSGIGARGGPAPYLRVEIALRALSQTFRIQVIHFQARVSVGKVLIAVAQPIELGEGVGTGDGGIKLEGPLSREALRYMESQFREHRKCSLTIALHTQLWFRDDVAANPQFTHVVPSGQWGVLPTQQQEMYPQITRDDWLENVVRVIQPDEYAILEVPIPPTPNRGRFEKALTHLATAQERFTRGDDPGVLQSCHGAFESLSPGAPKDVLAKLTDPEKRKHLDELLLAAKAYLHAGRHVSKAGARLGEFDVDHRDAEFALGITKMAISYVARLLAE